MDIAVNIPETTQGGTNDSIQEVLAAGNWLADRGPYEVSDEDLQRMRTALNCVQNQVQALINLKQTMSDRRNTPNPTCVHKWGTGTNGGDTVRLCLVCDEEADD